MPPSRDHAAFREGEMLNPPSSEEAGTRGLFVRERSDPGYYSSVVS